MTDRIITPQIVEEILSLRASGHTKRWHVLPHLGTPQTVAEHSAQAVSLLLTLHPNPSVALIAAMLWHDSAERVVGDVPAPIRRKRESLAREYEDAEREFFAEHPTAWAAMHTLTEEDWHWLKAVDILELLLWCADQVYLGNRHCEIVMRRAITYLDRDTTPGPVREFVHQLSNQSYRSFA